MSASAKRARRRQALAKAPQHDRGADGLAISLAPPTRPQIDPEAPAGLRRALMMRHEMRLASWRRAAAAIAGTPGEAARDRAVKLTETAAAGVWQVNTQDGHLIDRLHRYGQINDRQYEAGLRLLEMCGAAGLLIAGAAQYGRIGHGGEMSDEMAYARAGWNRVMQALGSQRADLMTSLCHERHPGVAWLATTQSALCWLGDRWGIQDCGGCARKRLCGGMRG